MASGKSKCKPTGKPQGKTKEQQDGNKTNEHLIIAAIDFGTTYTGFAFVPRHDSLIQSSMFGPPTMRSEKAPTSVLLDKDKKFEDFGYDAEEQYENICEDGKSDDYFYFERFKMALYETKKLTRDTMLKDKTGKEVQALHVFAVVIQHLTECVYKILKTQQCGTTSDDVLWVLTVPAIWSDSAKQFMREAASKAGIEDENLKLILEPEAASVYCQDQKLYRVVKMDDSVQLEKLPVGEKYIVADLGGGTADIAVHEVLEDNNLKEISRSDGDAHGGMQVDQAFMQFLEDIYGPEVMSTLRKDISILKGIRATFEQKKRNFDNSNKWITMQLTGVPTAIEHTEGADLDTIKTNALQRFKDKIKFKFGDKICIHPELMQQFFEPAINGIIKFIQKLRRDDNVGIINTAVLVGGLSASEYIQHMIRNNIAGLRVIVPKDPGLAVLKGAVLFGKNPSQITQRIARFSYGFSVARKFKEHVDPDELKVERNHVMLCNDVFDTLITKGESLVKGSVRQTFVSKIAVMDDLLTFVLSSSLPVVSKVYKSENKEPKYTTTEHGSECIGTLVIKPPPGGWPPLAIIAQGFIVGESELRAFATDMNSDLVFLARLDCL